MTDRSSLPRALQRMRSFLIRRRVDIVMSTDLLVPAVGTTDHLTVEKMGVNHRPALEAHVRRYHGQTAQSLVMVDECFRRGFGGVVGLLDGEIVGFRWWAGRDHDHPHFGYYALRPAADEVYAFGLYVARPYRAQGYAFEIVGKMARHLSAIGYRRVFCLVQQDNVASLRVQIHCGAREMARRPVVCLFDRVLWCGGRLHHHDPQWM